MKKTEILRKFNDYFFDDAFNSNCEPFFQFLILSGGITDPQQTANSFIFCDTKRNKHCSYVYQVSFRTCV